MRSPLVSRRSYEAMRDVWREAIRERDLTLHDLEEANREISFLKHLLNEQVNFDPTIETPTGDALVAVDMVVDK